MTDPTQTTSEVPNPLPTLGRIVHFYDGRDTFAAVVIGVPSSPSLRAAGACSLSIWRPHREDLHVTPVFFSSAPAADKWSWPPRV